MEALARKQKFISLSNLFPLNIFQITIQRTNGDSLTEDIPSFKPVSYAVYAAGLKESRTRHSRVLQTKPLPPARQPLPAVCSDQMVGGQGGSALTHPANRARFIEPAIRLTSPRGRGWL